MDVADLKEYLSIVVDMEKNIQMQEQVISKLRAKSETLGIAKEIKGPKPFVDPAKGTGTLILISLMLFAGCIFCAFVLPWLLRGISSPLVFFAGLLGLAGLLGCIPAAIFVIMSVITAVSAVWRAPNVENEHQQKVEEYNELMTTDEARVETELCVKRAICFDLQMLEDICAESKQRLKKIYSENIIFPKYRNLIMACSLYEYICAGRCTELEGHEGAYNILEMEIRMDRIITQLDRVISQLSAIQQNQFMLYSAIQESNQRSAQILDATNRMADSLQGFQGNADALNEKIAELQKTSALNAYHTERVQKELAYMNRMDYLTGRNDGVFDNYPPMQ